jgi:putative inorganic carbon (HCO3(-)) transporter
LLTLPSAWTKKISKRSHRDLALLGLALAAAVAITLLPLTWAALLGVGGALVLITLVRPWLGLLMVVPAVPFGSLRQAQMGVINVGLEEALVALVLAAWLLRMMARREVRWRWPPLSLPLLLFLGVLLLSSLSAISLQHSLKEMVKWVEVLALYVMAANELGEQETYLLVAVMLGTGALAALQGIYQFLFQVGPEGFVLFGRFMRAYGTFEQPNPYAGYLGLTLPIALGVVMAGVLTMTGRARIWWLIWAGGCGALMLAALIMSWSRGAWLGFAAAVAVMILALVVRKGRGAVLLVVAVLLVFYLLLAMGVMRVPPVVAERFSDLLPYAGISDVRGAEVTDANFAVLERMAHWQSALAMWTDHPWLGVGIGNYEPAYGSYALPQWTEPLGHAHNYYLNIAAESGLLGLVAYLLLWGAALLGAWRATQRSRGIAWGVALGIVGVLVHLAVHHLFDNLFVHGIYLHLGLLLAVLPSLTAAKERTNRSAGPAVGRVGL